MTGATTPVSGQREPELAGQTVVLIGGSAGIGLETARLARAEGAEVVLTGRNPDRLKHAAADVGARSTAAFDATDPASVKKFFQDLPAPIDHVLITAGGPHYAPLLEMDADQVRGELSGHVVQALDVARNAAPTMRPGGTLLLMGGSPRPSWLACALKVPLSSAEPPTTANASCVSRSRIGPPTNSTSTWRLKRFSATPPTPRSSAWPRPAPGRGFTRRTAAHRRCRRLRR